MESGTVHPYRFAADAGLACAARAAETSYVGRTERTPRPGTQAMDGWPTPRPGAFVQLAGSSARSARGKLLLMDVLDRITHDPAVMGGRPCIRGLRVTVGTIVGLLAAGETEAQILHAYPYLEPGDVQAALAYAAWRTQETELPLP
jgi:uncharacterized protein (DUF433 family)